MVFCGTFVLENPGAAGTYMLISPAAARLAVFRTVGGLSLTEFVALLDPGEAGYISKPRAEQP